MDSLSNEILHTPSYSKLNSYNGIEIFIDPEGPNWISTDRKGAKILSFIDGKKTFNEVVRLYSTEQNLPFAKAWVDVDAFIKDSVREKFVSLTPFSRAPYKGRADYIELTSLSELWIHTNNSCNLQCTHCLVESGPSGDRGTRYQNAKRTHRRCKNTGRLQILFYRRRAFYQKRYFRTD